MSFLLKTGFIGFDQITDTINPLKAPKLTMVRTVELSYTVRAPLDLLERYLALVASAIRLSFPRLSEKDRVVVVQIFKKYRFLNGNPDRTACHTWHPRYYQTCYYLGLDLSPKLLNDSPHYRV